MRLITVARKPLTENTVALNVLAHGTGALNINAARIGTEARVNAAAGNKAGGSSYNMSAVGMPTDAAPTAAVGRWPANLVLQHSPGCTCAGTVRVKANGNFPSQQNTTSWKMSSKGKGLTPEADRKDADGMELIAAWQCVPGCPVADLDAESGERKTTWVTASHHNNRGTDFLGTMGHPGDQGYNDTGGASRFFKQVKTDG